MITVGAYEAKTHLSELLDKVALGENVVITKHRVPVARLVPDNQERREPVVDVVNAIREFRKGRRRGDLTVKEMINEGRR